MSATPLVVIPARFSASASAHRYAALSTARTLSAGRAPRRGRAAGRPPVGARRRGDPRRDRAPARFRRRGAPPGRRRRLPRPLRPGRWTATRSTTSTTSRTPSTWPSPGGHSIVGSPCSRSAAAGSWSTSPSVAISSRTWPRRTGTSSTPSTSCPARCSPTRSAPRSRRPASTTSAYDGSATACSAAAYAADGTVEGAVLPDAPGWFLGVQWHPEDTVGHRPRPAGPLPALVDAARQPCSGLRLTTVRRDRARSSVACWSRSVVTQASTALNSGKSRGHQPLPLVGQRQQHPPRVARVDGAVHQALGHQGLLHSGQRALGDAGLRRDVPALDLAPDPDHPEHDPAGPGQAVRSQHGALEMVAHRVGRAVDVRHRRPSPTCPPPGPASRSETACSVASRVNSPEAAAPRSAAAAARA